MNLVHVSHCQHLFDQCPQNYHSVIQHESWATNVQRKTQNNQECTCQKRRKYLPLRRMTKITFLKIHLKSNNQMNVFFSLMKNYIC